MLMIVCRSDSAQQPGRAEVGDRRGRSAVERPAADPRFPDAESREMFQSAAGRVLNFRDRETNRRLELAAASLDSRNPAPGLQVLQRIIENEDDHFTFTDGTAAVGLRRFAFSTLNDLDRLNWGTYNLLFDGEARKLAESKSPDARRRDREIVRRFLFTRSGFDAGHRLATRAFDRGDYGRAANLWQRLRSIRHHRDRITPALSLKLGVALHRSQRPAAAAEVLKEIQNERFRIGGKMTTVRDFHRRLSAEEPAAALTGWPTPNGNAESNREADVSTPVPDAVWSRGYAGSSNSLAQRFADDWTRRERGGGRPTAVVNSPLYVDGRVVLRDFSGIRALDLKSGETKWFCKTETSLEKSAASLSTRTRGNDPNGSQAESDFGPAYAGNDVLHSLTSDGRRVYFVDGMDLTAAASIGNDRNEQLRRMLRGRGRFRRQRETDDPEYNKLSAVDLRDASDRSDSDDSQRKPLWTLGGSPDEKDRPLAGHYFLGPPLPFAGNLYVVCEFDERVQLLCLRPEDGRVEWRQTLLLTGDDHYADAARWFAACTPVASDGVVVCPTRRGFLAAVDAFSGSLLWAAFTGNRVDELSADPTRTKRKPQTHPGFRSSPIVHGGRVFELAPDAANLLCFDLQSGRTLWTAPREDGEYIAVADETNVLVVGRRTTRSYAVQTGKRLWTTATGVPSGRGLAISGRYLLPVSDGRVLTLDRRSGRPIGFSLPGLASSGKGGAKSAEGENDWRPGNLIAAGDFVLSAEVDRLQAFPQASQRLDFVQRKLKRQHQATGGFDPRDQFTAAQLSLLIGERKEADRLLTAALDRLDKTQPAAGSDAHKQQTQTRRLLRELLFARLNDANAPSPDVLERIGRLSVLPDDRARYLMRRAEFELQRGDVDAVLKTVDEFARLDVHRLFPRPRDESHLVSFSAWVPDLLERARRKAGGTLQRKLARRMTDRLQAALRSPGVESLERFLAVFGSFPQAAAARNELARRLIAVGEYQRAELALLANRERSVDPADPADSAQARQRAAATELLFRLQTKLRLHDNAAGLLHELATRFADVPCGDGNPTGRELVERFRRETLTDLAFRRIRGPAAPVDRVDVREDRWLRTDDSISRTYGSFRQLFRTPRDGPFELLDLGTGLETEVSVVDRFSGVSVGRFTIPTRHSYPVSSGSSFVGRYFSLGSPGRMHGISLLERSREAPLWTTAPQGFQQRDDMLLVGPAGPRVAVFQSRELLAAVDPGTGRLLWQRNDLQPLSGLNGDPYSGLFGDEEVLVLFAGDRERYTVFDTQTGDVVRTGKLDVDREYERRLFGRRMFYVSQQAGKTRMRLWDPATNRFLIDRPFNGRLFVTTTDDDADLLVLAPGGELLVFNPQTGELKHTLRFDAGETNNVTYLKAFRSGGRLFVNPQRSVAVHDPFFSFYAGDTFVPAEHVAGELYAFDLKSGRRLWKRLLPQRTALLPRHGDLPFLVLAVRIRDRRDSQRASLLIDVLDGETGDSLGRRDDLLPTRIRHLWYSPAQNAVVLEGTQTTIRLHLHRRRPIGPQEATPL